MARIQIKPYLKLALPLDFSFIWVSQTPSLCKTGRAGFSVTSKPVHPNCTLCRTSKMCWTPSHQCSWMMTQHRKFSTHKTTTGNLEWENVQSQTGLLNSRLSLPRAAPGQASQNQNVPQSFQLNAIIQAKPTHSINLTARVTYYK